MFVCLDQGTNLTAILREGHGAVCREREREIGLRLVCGSMEENKCRSGHDTKSSCTLWDVIASRQEIETNPRKVLLGGGGKCTLSLPLSLPPLSVSSLSFVSNTLLEWFLRKCVSASSALYSGSGLSWRVLKMYEGDSLVHAVFFFFFWTPRHRLAKKPLLRFCTLFRLLVFL